MSKIVTEVSAKIYLELTEGEAGALDAICGYGPEKFLAWFKRNLGAHYIKPYEKHLKTLFEKARALKDAVDRVEKMRQEVKQMEV